MINALLAAVLIICPLIVVVQFVASCTGVHAHGHVSIGKAQTATMPRESAKEQSRCWLSHLRLSLHGHVLLTQLAHKFA